MIAVTPTKTPVESVQTKQLKNLNNLNPGFARNYMVVDAGFVREKIKTIIINKFI